MKKRRTFFKSHEFGIIALVVVLLCVGAGVATIRANNKLKIKNEEINDLNAQITEAAQKNEDLNNEADYRNSKEYLESEARKLFGMVYPDEIILEQSDGSDSQTPGTVKEPRTQEITTVTTTTGQ